MKKSRICFFIILCLSHPVYHVFCQNFQWVKSYALVYNSGRDEGTGVAINSSGQVLITGYISNRMYIAKYDQAGTQISTREFTSNSSVKALDITIGQNSDIFITGEYTGKVTFGNISLTSKGNHDVFLLKLNKWFDPLWAKSLGGWDYDQGQKVVTDDNGDVFVAGEMNGRFWFDSAYFQSLGQDIFLGKYSPSGHLCWMKHIGGMGYNILGAMKSHGDYIYLTGEITKTAIFDTITVINNTNTDNVFTAKFNQDGHALWVESSTAPALYYNWGGCSYGLAINDQGDVYTSGFDVNGIIFGNDTLIAGGLNRVFIAKYDSEGNYMQAKQLWGLNCFGAEIGTDGGVFLTGYYQTIAIFGNDTLWPWGGWRNAFIVKLTASLDPSWAKTYGCADYTYPDDIAIDPNNNIFVTGYYESYGTNAVFWPYTLPGGWGAETFLTKLHDNCVSSRPPSSFNSYPVIFPNPFEHKIRIKDKGTFEFLSIYNSYGSLLASIHLERYTDAIDLTSLQKGIYIAVLESSNGKRHIEKLVKI